MRWKIFLGVVLTILVVISLLIYYFIPFNTLTFDTQPVDSSFNPGVSGFVGMQFYENIRYQDSNISYKIYPACSLKKENDMEQAIDILENSTILDFYPVLYGEEISITCSNENRFEEGLFVGGEGGVTNVTILENFHIVFNGKVLLIRDSKCSTPNIAIHELLHALGFEHSSNQYNIMYETTNCRQTVGDEIPQLIDQLYSIPSEPDLAFENASAFLNGKYLNANLSVRNDGLIDARASEIIILADGEEVKRFELEPLEIGYGSKFSLSNLWIKKSNIDEIEFVIQSDFEELDKVNNRVVLELKK